MRSFQASKLVPIIPIAEATHVLVMSQMHLYVESYVQIACRKFIG